MLFTNILTITALATSAMAGYAGGHPANGGSHVSTGNKAPANKPAHHDARDTREHEKSPSNKPDQAEDGADSHDEFYDRHGNKIDRRNGGVYWCSKNNWKGSCTKSAADNTCHSWAYGPSGSFGPDPGVTCTFYDEAGCKGDSTIYKYPGSGQVTYWGTGGVTFVPEAWRCHT